VVASLLERAAVQQILNPSFRLPACPVSFLPFFHPSFTSVEGDGGWIVDYRSNYIQHAQLSDLIPDGQQYFYQVGDGHHTSEVDKSAELTHTHSI
jgi:hypothetical protein